jgi:tetratricopeptide (TPR) repeat protein
MRPWPRSWPPLPGSSVEQEYEAGRLDEALTLARDLFARQPGDAEASYRLAMIHHARGETREALAWARRALILAPDHAAAHVAAAEALLLSGDYAEGWAEYAWRFRLPGAAPLLPEPLALGRPQWQGEPLSDGQLMLVGDQGFGDVIQFSRFVPWVLGQTRRVVLGASDEMAPLIRRMFPDLPIATRAQDYRDFTACCPLSGLPRLHGTRVETIPPPVPVPVDRRRADAWHQRLSAALPPEQLRIGIVWAGRPTHPNDGHRSVAFAALAAALGVVPGIVLVSLQKGERAGDLLPYSGAAPLFDAAPYLTDYEETAAAIAALDLVVTVDTSVAHLAGTMGHPTWLLLPFVPDWRWGLGREETPWYPSLRLFRQQAHGAWGAPLAAVAALLSAAR